MADCIKIGNLDISAVRIGSTDPIIYVGGVKVYPTTPSVPKFYATYLDGTDYTVQCNSSSTLTTDEARGHSTPYSAMTTAVIGDCATRIESATFYNFPNLESIILSDNLTSIESYTFSRCTKLASIEIPSGVTSINSNAFSICTNLTTINIPNGVTSIDNYIFSYCSKLSAVTIPSDVTQIGNSSFSNCGSLASIDIPSGVTSIGNNAFFYCTGLTSIIVNATTPATLGTNAFDYTYCAIYVPCDSVDAYKAASGWSTYASRIQAIPGSCAPTLQWVEFNNGDTIDTNLDIYGVSGNSMYLSVSLFDSQEQIYFSLERATVYGYIGYPNICYTNSYSTSDTVELTFSDIGCSDYYNLGNSTTVNSTIKLLIYQ